MKNVLTPQNTVNSPQARADIFNLMLEPALLLDGMGLIIDVNEAFQRVFAMASDSLNGSCFMDMLTMDASLKDTIKKNYAAYMVDGRTMSFEGFIPTVSGKGMWAVVNCRVFIQDSRLYCITTLNDISAQKKTIRDLQASGTHLKNIFDNVNDLVQSTGPEGQILYANQKWLHSLGYQPSDLAGLNIVDILREDQVKHCFAIMQRVKKGEEFEFVDVVFRSKDGRDVMVEGNISGQFEEGRFVATRGIFRDVTYKKNLEETYTLLIKNSPTPMYVVQKGRFKFVNSSFQQLTGYNESELIGKESITLVHSQDKKAVARSAISSLKSHRPTNYEFRMITKEGEARWVMETVISIPYEGGRAALGTLADLSQHKMFEKALEEAHVRYQTLFNSAGDAIYIHDKEGRILEVNDATCQLLGYSRAELNKLNIADVCFPESGRALKKYILDVVKNKVSFAVTELTASRGKRIPVEINCKFVTYNNQPAILTVARDITERNQIESIRLKSQARSESLLKINEYPTNNVQELLYFALEEILTLTESKYGFLYDYEESSQQLKMRVLSKETFKKCAVSKHQFCSQLEKMGILGEAIRQNKPIISSTVQVPQTTTNGFPDGNYKISNYLILPVRSINKIVGIVGVANKIHDYDASDIHQVMVLISSVQNILEKLEVKNTLAESEQRFRQLIELSQDGIIRLDTEGRVVTANPAAAKMFGYLENEIVGIPFSDTMIPEDKLQAQKRWKQLTAGKAMRFEREAVRKDGTRFPLEVSISPLTQGYYQNVVRDISTRKQMEFQLHEKEKQYRQMIENQSDLIAEINLKGELKFLNPAYLRLCGKSQIEMIGKSVNELIHPDDMEQSNQKAILAYSPPYSTYSESRMKTKDGWRWIAWNVNAVMDKEAKITSFTCIGRDITESKLAKEELEQANERLRELDKLKDNFLSTVSHELRTPLTSIKSFSEILLSYDEDPKTQKEFLGIINDESDRLTRLINDFLDISKIQAGRMQWKTQPVSINDAIRQAVNSARPLIEKEKLHMVSEIEPELPAVMSDKDRLIQVVTNLLGNAIKFTPEGGTIQLRAWQAQANPGDKKMITVSIADSGIGIAPENFHKIFENFGQVGDVLKDRPKGTGLGLPICKKIVETFGGKIWLESTLGKGSTFFFSLPQAESAEEVKTEVCKIQSPGQTDCNKLILVVDDEANIRRLIKYELTERGYQVKEASGGKEAVDKARQYHPDLITLDISMPDLNGFDVCAVLKNDGATRNIPIMIISVIDDAQKAAELGVADYITKPINLDIMLQKISRLVGTSSQPKTAD